MPYVEERLARIEAYLGLAPYDPLNTDPGNTGGGSTGGSGLQVPTFFRLVENTNHSVTATWSGSAASYEVHEFLADPANTLKATVTSTTRTSGPLTVGNTYEYAVRAVNGAEYSAFSERLRITIGSGVDPVPTGGGTTTGGGTAGGGTNTGGQTLGVGGVATPAGAVLATADKPGVQLDITVGGTSPTNRKVYDGQGHEIGLIKIRASYVTVQNYRIRSQVQYGVDCKLGTANKDVIIQNCDIKDVRPSGDGDLNCFTINGNGIKILYNTAVNFVGVASPGSHTDFIQTWNDGPGDESTSDLWVIGNRAEGVPVDNGDKNHIHQFLIGEGRLSTDGGGGGTGVSQNWYVSDNYMTADCKFDDIDNVVFTRNNFAGVDKRVVVVTSLSTGFKYYSDNVVSGEYTIEIGASVIAGAGPASPLATAGSTTTNPGTTSGAPGEKFNLTRWYVTLPIAATDGSDTSGPWDIYNPRLKTFVHPRYFYLDASGNLKLEAPVKGVTTSAASGATRDEFREETAAGNHAAWTAATVTTSLTCTLSADPSNIDGRKEAIVGQIHSAGGTPPVYLAVNHNSATGTLSFFKNGPSAGVLITGLKPTDVFTYRIAVSGGRCKIYAAKGDVSALPATPQFDFPTSDFNEGTGCYFKAGVYNKQDIASATTGSTFGTIYRLDLV